MGVSVTPQSIYNKRKAMLRIHKELMDNTAHKFVKHAEYRASAEGYVSSGCGPQHDGVVMSNLESRVSPFPETQSQHSERQETSVCILTNGAGCSFPAVKSRFAVSLPANSRYSTPTTPCTPSDDQTLIPPQSFECMKAEVSSHSVGGTTVMSGTGLHNWLPRQPVCSGAHYVTADQRQSLMYHKNLLKEIRENPAEPFEALGDNFDIMKNPTSMTKERQRESLHWFLLLIAKKRITNPELPNDAPKADITVMEPGYWLPTPAELEKHEMDVSFHIARVLVKYMDFLLPYTECLPTYISHPYLAQSAQKSEVLNAELIDAPENSMEGIIKIIKRLKKLLVPRKGGSEPEVIERIVLGGDVLTNERAFAGQAALANADNEVDSCCGIIHRPEGLHRLMNLALVTAE